VFINNFNSTTIPDYDLVGLFVNFCLFYL